MSGLPRRLALARLFLSTTVGVRARVPTKIWQKRCKNVSAAKKMGLGRGFDALIPRDVDTALLFEEHERIQKVALEALSPNPHQPRTTFDEESLRQLAASIKQYGILQPLVVRPAGQGSYIIVA